MRNEGVAMQELHTAAHPGLIHLRAEHRTARILQFVRMALMDLGMGIGGVVAPEIGVDCETYPYAAMSLVQVRRRSPYQTPAKGLSAISKSPCSL